MKKLKRVSVVGLSVLSFMTLTTGFTRGNVQSVIIDVDGKVIETYAVKFTPEAALETNGIKLSDNDEYVVVKNENDIKVHVLRAVPVSVQVEGAGATYYNTTIKNINAFLKANGYDMEKYEANVPLDGVIMPNTRIVLEDKEAKLARLKAAEEAKRKQSRTSRGSRETVSTLTMEATAYLPSDGNGDGITAMGIPATYGVVAVDPNVIPLGTRLYIEGYGEAIAADTGGAIKRNKIDLCMESYSEAINFGRRNVTVHVLR